MAITFHNKRYMKKNINRMLNGDKRVMGITTRDPKLFEAIVKYLKKTKANIKLVTGE